MMNAVELVDHYKAVRARLNNPPPAIRPPKPEIVRTLYGFPIGPINQLARTIYTRPIGPGMEVAYCIDTHPRVKPMGEILKEVCRKYGFSVLDIKSMRRQGPLVRARFEFMWRAKKETKRSLPEIGRFLGKDHTTVLHGVRRFQDMIDRGIVERPA